MKRSALLLLLVFVTTSLTSQENFIQIKTNKILCMMNFLETAIGDRTASISYRKYIEEELEGDAEFQTIVGNYKSINLQREWNFDDYPEGSRPYKNTKDLIWMAAVHASDIDDFCERITGVLLHQNQVNMIQAFKDVEPYFDRLIWNEEQGNIARMENQMAKYQQTIADLFLRISTFYGTSWDTSIPFIIALNPIPLKEGMTTAIPKGNALICSYLSHNPDDYLSTVGIAVHEMCHILYDEQPLAFKKNLDAWFVNNESMYSSLAYGYINEGLATVLGNGWSYNYIHNKLDENDWYSDDYINGFAQALYPLTVAYMKEEKEIDSIYVSEAISLFEKTFPNSLNEVDILFNDLVILANIEEFEVDQLFDDLMRNFRVTSLNLSTPIADKQSEEYYYMKGKTKLFLINSKHEETVDLINQNFKNAGLTDVRNSIYSFIDNSTKSPIIVLNIDSMDNLAAALLAMKDKNILDYGQLLKW